MRWFKVAQFKVALGAALAACAITGCASASASPSIAIASAYVAQPATTHATTVGYLTIRNNGPADELVAVSTSVGGTVTLRAPARAGSQPLAMHTVSEIPIASEAMTQLIPNSFHLLITDAGPMTAGKDIKLTLTFAHAGKITILALVTNPETGGSSYFLN